MRKAVEESLRFGAQGIKVKVSGRLNGAEIARSECTCRDSCRCTRACRHRLRFGRSAHYIRADWRKVWIYRGEILDAKAAMARGTGSDPINETRMGERERRPRTRREREGGGGSVAGGRAGKTGSGFGF